MKFYGIKTCDTCRKAIRELTAAGCDFDYVDLRKDGISADTLHAAYDAVGAALINKSSTTWRGLDEGQRGQDPVDLLLTHPTLIKRPLIERAGAYTVGWKADVRGQYLN